MSGASSIEWTDATWNPVRGCSRVSEGCRNCYAEKFAARFAKPKEHGAPAKSPAGGYAGFVENTAAGPRWTGRVELIPSALEWPLRKRKPLRIFVNSMSDLFHEKLSNEAIAAVFGVMAACPQHTFQILTKRPERMRQWFEWLHNTQTLFGYERVRYCAKVAHNNSHEVTINRDLLRLWDGSEVPSAWPLPNVWLGVSVEDQATADERIPHLLATPAAKQFVSYEPALGPVDFFRVRDPIGKGSRGCEFSALNTAFGDLDWMIVGGESGPGARPFDVAWARSTVEQCKAAGVACFVKQLGARPVTQHPMGPIGALVDAPCVDRKGGDWNEWPEDLRVREFPR